eukprot:scaffold13478_cov132-Cylindrotheca_fusiformis.AAC.38
MSSGTRATQQHAAPETTTKKKFGKNLNKLTKPPAPAVSSPPKQSASSRNGLLLLSTKRSSSTGNAASTSGGILSNKSAQPSKPRPALGLQYESSTSTHDALLGAVVGASRAEAQQQPDAWGVADKQPRSSKNESDTPSETNASETPEIAPKVDEPAPKEQEGSLPAPQTRESHPTSDFRGPSWDEYGGRNISPEKLEHATLVESDKDVKSIFMSERAKERAEKHQSEEAERMIQQKERAHQRLKELEERMGSDEKVGNPRDVSSAPVEQPQPRTLYDPNRPVSGKAVDNSMSNDMEPKYCDVDRNGMQNSSLPEDSLDPNKYDRAPMIQLSSYSDRDRRERGAAAGPRMLFDPKSGSMVAVPSKEENSGGRGRKERGKKVRNGRDKDIKADTKTDNEGSKVAGRKGKTRRDDNAPQSKSRVGSDALSPPKADSKKGRVVSDKKLPRTCGVLYAKDNKGHYYCVDGAEGDLGYGAHSVPGGKARNPDAYEVYISKKKEVARDHSKSLENAQQESSYKDTLMHDSALPPEVALQTGFNVVKPEPKIDWVKPNEKISLVTGNADSPMLQATAKEWAPSPAMLSAAAAAAADRTTSFQSSIDSVDGSSEGDAIPVSRCV